MVKELFGGSKSKKTSNSSSGFGSLPSDLQDQYRTLLDKGEQLINNPDEFFAPISQTADEALAGLMAQPENFQDNISNYLNPYRDMITSDINMNFEDQFNALSQQADVAGAFGGSRYDKGLYDVERARSDAVARAGADQYGQAANLSQQGIQNLLSLGQLERGIDYGQKQALPSALSSFGNLISPLLNSRTDSSYSTSDSYSGMLDGILPG